MKYVYPTFKENITIEPIAQYVRKAYAHSKALKRSYGAEQAIETCDRYFAARDTMPDKLIIKLNCDMGQAHVMDHKVPASDKEKAGQQVIEVQLDSIRLRISTFLAVITDAIREVDKPWTIEPSPLPEFPDDAETRIVETLSQVVAMQLAEVSQGDEVTLLQNMVALIKDEGGAYDMIRQERDRLYETVQEELKIRAADSASLLDTLIYDQIRESNFTQQLDLFFRYLGMYNFSVIKSPEWVYQYNYRFKKGTLKELLEVRLNHETVHPANYFCAKNKTFDSPGSFEMDIGRITFSELSDLYNFGGVGFQKDQIKYVMDLFCDRNLNWLADDFKLGDGLEQWNGYEDIPIIRYYGTISAEVIQSLVTSKDAKKLKSQLKDFMHYECVAWVIHDYVVYFSINLSRKITRPYRVSSYSKHGNHPYEGKGIFALCIPHQMLMDDYYTMLFENAGLASAGIIAYNSRKIDLKEFVPEMIKGGARIPVKTSFADGGNDRVIYQVQFNSYMNELLMLIQNQDNLMDKHSEIPASSIGFGDKLSSIRSTGIASINQEAVNKAVLRKVHTTEIDVIEPIIALLVTYSLIKTTDPRIIKGAVDVVVNGYSGVMRKQNKAQNTDLVMQNAIGFLNAFAQLQASGIDTTGLLNLFKTYLDNSGVDSSKFMPTASVSAPTNAPAQGRIGMTQIPVDGRTTAPMMEATAP